MICILQHLWIGQYRTPRLQGFQFRPFPFASLCWRGTYMYFFLLCSIFGKQLSVIKPEAKLCSGVSLVEGHTDATAGNCCNLGPWRSAAQEDKPTSKGF